MHKADVEESTLQLVLDQLEELAVTLLEEIRERPGVALGIGAGIAGAILGAKFAARLRRPKARVPRPARNVGDAAELIGLGVRLMQNPIVRGLILAAIERQLRRKLAL